MRFSNAKNEVSAVAWSIRLPCRVAVFFPHKRMNQNALLLGFTRIVCLDPEMRQGSSVPGIFSEGREHMRCGWDCCRQRAWGWANLSQPVNPAL
mmetsp:Transcript_4535/g.10235  ORF Transcript_4535/g.10235 Transcript_4535/m.10235 type:complete len:94 (-) Transcript_4535:244-525(-)